jgi:transcriptional regulator with XRE-family HTH domain
MREAREALGISQRELGRRIGLDRSIVNRVERGLRQITLTEVFKIAHALSTSPIHLLTPREDEPVEIAGRVIRASKARAWICGRTVMLGTDVAAFFRNAPDSEVRALAEAWLVRTQIEGRELGWALTSPETREALVTDVVTALRQSTAAREGADG